MTHHPSRSVVTIIQIVLTISWIIIAVMSSLPLFASTSYRHYPNLFACDIADVSVLVISDSFVVCMPAVAVLSMGLYQMTSGQSHSSEHRISYVVSSGRMNVQPNEDLPKMKRVTEAAVAISAALFLEWTVRIAAVLGADNSSKYLFTLSLFFMLTFVLCAPSCLLLVSRFPVVHISSQEGYGSRRCSRQDNFTFSPHIADLQSVPSSLEVNLRPADLRLDGDQYRRCAMHAQSRRDLPNTPPGQDLPNTHPRGDLRNSPLSWGHPNGRDDRMTPLELDLLHSPPGRLHGSTPAGRDLLNNQPERDLTSTPLGQGVTNSPIGRGVTSTPLGRDLQNTPFAWDLPNTSPGRHLRNTPPVRDLQNSPFVLDLQNNPLGRVLQNSQLGRDLQNSPLEQDLQNAPLEGDLENITSEVIVDSLTPPTTPDLALKRNSVSCQLSVGSWIRNEQRRTSSAWLRIQNNTMSRSCPDVSEELEEMDQPQ